jgi:hypothetical protein
MFCLIGSGAEQHFDAAALMSYRAHHGWTESLKNQFLLHRCG